MIAENVYKSIYEYMQSAINEYENQYFIDNNVSVEFMQDLYGVLIQRLGFDVIKTNILRENTISFKFVVTSFQDKFDDAEKKLDVSLYLDGIKEFIENKFTTEKPMLPTGCEVLGLKAISNGIQTNTDNSVSYKCDYEFLYKINKE